MNANGSRKRQASEADDEETPEPSNISPAVIHNFCRHLLDLDDNGSIALKNRTGRTSFTNLFNGPNAEGFEDFDLSEIQKAFRDYYRKATAITHVPMRSALEQVMLYADTPKAVELHPAFPQRPPGRFALFCQLKGTWFAKISEADKQQFHDKNDKVSRKVDQDLEHQQKEYLQKLKEFLENERDNLMPSHVDHVTKVIRQYKKLTNEPTAPTPKKKSKKEPRKKLTAFDYYKLTKTKKYLHLDAEEREAKLQRHFNKLDDDDRQVFEDIAANAQNDD